MQFHIKKNKNIIHGVLLLDKPYGLSSNNALKKIKYLLNAKKVGYTGTLDPFATGLLPLCFGEATKFSNYLSEADKYYEAIIHLGITTETGDIEGKIIDFNKNIPNSIEIIEKILINFHGKISQIPPMYSALKYKGIPLYKYARSGITIKRKLRYIKIYKITIIDYTIPYLTLRIHCSKGTYIRVLSEDIGKMLGCGAHLKYLRRIGIDKLTLDKCLNIDTIIKYSEYERISSLIPIDILLSSFGIIYLSDLLSKRFLHGQNLFLSDEYIYILIKSGFISNNKVRVYNKKNCQFLGIGFINNFFLLTPVRLISLF
ncbi:tRNA pseudouridine(55) synthase TruB [Candidatus Profftella armatura]